MPRQVPAASSPPARAAGETPANQPARRRRYESVFAKLVAIMIVMAASLMVLVAIFFTLAVGPSLNQSINGVIEQYGRVIAASAPDLEQAKALKARTGVEIRYEGPSGSWTTNDDLVSIATARERGWSRYHVVPSPKGGSYLFVETFRTRLRSLHAFLLWGLLGLMVVVIVVTHAVIRRLLRPLADLGGGVAQLSNGQLDVVVPRRTRDEFGALTDAFNQMVGRVRDMIRARDQLLIDVSHELRSPVTRMKVALELLPDSEKKTRMAADLAEMEQMIGELLELERLREGRIRKERCALRTILEAVAASCPGAVIAPAPDVTLDADAGKLQTVIRNLVENAMKYSLPDSRPVEVSAAREGEQVVIRVVDDGPGIPEADLQNIFEPFYRVDRSRSRKTGGYGLGLSIAKRIVDAHGGTIAAENRVPRGATFTVRL